MQLGLYKRLQLKEGLEVTVVALDPQTNSVSYRSGEPPFGIVLKNDYLIFLADDTVKEIVMPNFEYHKLTLLEAMEVCKTPEWPEELRYMHNLDNGCWYHLSESGQFHKYLKVPGEDKYYWVTSEITLDLIKGRNWAVPNAVSGYVPLFSDGHVYHNFSK